MLPKYLTNVIARTRLVFSAIREPGRGQVLSFVVDESQTGVVRKLCWLALIMILTTERESLF